MKKKREPAAVARAIKLSIVAALAAQGDVAGSVTRAVVSALSVSGGGAAGPTGARVAGLIALVADEAIRGALETGCNLMPVAQGLMAGILCGSRLVGSEVIDTIRQTASITLKAVAGVRGEGEAAGNRLVRGAVQGAI